MKYFLLALIFAVPASADAPVFEDAALGAVTMEWDCEMEAGATSTPGFVDEADFKDSLNGGSRFGGAPHSSGKDSWEDPDDWKDR